MRMIICNTGRAALRWRDHRSAATPVGTRRLRTALAVLLASLGASVQADDAPAPDSTRANAGYSAGFEFGRHLTELRRQDPGVDLQAVFNGILDALSGAEPRLSAAEMRTSLQQLERTGTGTGNADSVQPSQPPARSGGYVDDFAALNAKREGVVTLPSGVQYEVLKTGAGPRPGAADAVVVSYQGSLTTGAVFDSTYADGEPARLQLKEIAVPGLKEALLLMNEGAKWRVVIPPSMGFRNSGNNLLRRRDLIYEIEVLAVEPGGSRGATPGPPADPAGRAAAPASAAPEPAQP
jgi:FKBP-type peptidyl-prolyl cis-trans isomerase FklB